jgi:hypothetical protein
MSPQPWRERGQLDLHVTHSRSSGGRHSPSVHHEGEELKQSPPTRFNAIPLEAGRPVVPMAFIYTIGVDSVDTNLTTEDCAVAEFGPIRSTDRSESAQGVSAQAVDQGPGSSYGGDS